MFIALCTPYKIIILYQTYWLITDNNCTYNTVATLRVSGALQKSTEVMQAMQRLVRVPEVAQTMQDMSKEMMKAGIIEEMLDETMEDLDCKLFFFLVFFCLNFFIKDSEEMEEAAQTEIDKVLFEITEGKIGEAPLPPQDAAEKVSPLPATSVEEPEEEDEEEITEMQSRLAALKS